MKRPFASTLFFALMLFALLAPAASYTGELELQAKLDQLIAKNHGYGGGLLRVQQQESLILWEGASGNWGYETGPIMPQHTFEIASITKTFTATLILQMHEDQGSTVKLSSRIGDLLPDDVVRSLLVIDGHDYGPEITVEQLLQHMSGLPDYWASQDFLFAFLADEERFWWPDELVAYAKDMKPIGVPGDVWHYADTNYVLLGMIIETVTGWDLQEVFHHQIFRPLGMDVTYLSYREEPASDLQESHRFEHAEDLYDKLRQSADWAGGGLVSNVDDLQRFMRALLRGELFAESETLGLMMHWIPARRAVQSARSIRYGMGLFRVGLGGGRGELWGHDGWGNAFMYYWPQEDILFTGTLNQVYNDWFPLVMEAVKQLSHTQAPRDR